MVLNVNMASAEELAAIGVRPDLAEAIVAWRDEHGPFFSVEDLAEVPRVGMATANKVANNAEFGPAEGEEGAGEDAQPEQADAERAPEEGDPSEPQAREPEAEVGIRSVWVRVRPEYRFGNARSAGLPFGRQWAQMPASDPRLEEIARCSALEIAEERPRS